MKSILLYKFARKICLENFPQRYLFTAFNFKNTSESASQFCTGEKHKLPSYSGFQRPSCFAKIVMLHWKKNKARKFTLVFITLEKQESKLVGCKGELLSSLW